MKDPNGDGSISDLQIRHDIYSIFTKQRHANIRYCVTPTSFESESTSAWQDDTWSYKLIDNSECQTLKRAFYWDWYHSYRQNYCQLLIASGNTRNRPLHFTLWHNFRGCVMCVCVNFGFKNGSLEFYVCLLYTSKFRFDTILVYRYRHDISNNLHPLITAV